VDSVHDRPRTRGGLTSLDRDARRFSQFVSHSTATMGFLEAPQVNSAAPITLFVDISSRTSSATIRLVLADDTTCAHPEVAWRH
jgi:hypothetical protein